MLQEGLSAPRLARPGIERLRRVGWIALFGLGLFFWIPVLLRARLGASALTGTTAPDLPVATAQAMDSRLPEPPSATPALVPTPTAPFLSRLVLTTTILGKTRRAAIVNGRLYREGDKIAAGSEFYRLAGVAEDRIELVSLGPKVGVKRSVILQPAAESDHDQLSSH